jgi:hypothetical protein
MHCTIHEINKLNKTKVIVFCINRALLRFSYHAIILNFSDIKYKNLLYIDNIKSFIDDFEKKNQHSLKKRVSFHAS